MIGTPRTTVASMTRRQTPDGEYSAASQTLLSNRTRIRENHSREREDFFFGHLDLARERIAPGEETADLTSPDVTQVSFDFLELFLGQFLDLRDDLGGGHKNNLANCQETGKERR